MRIRILTLTIAITLSLLMAHLSHGINEIILGQAGQPLYTLTITGSGDGSGLVTSNLYGMSCTSTAGIESGTCVMLIPMGTTIILTATAGSGSVFTGWTGSGCSGVGTCSILINGNKTVDATFTSSAHRYRYLYIGHIGARVTRLDLNDFSTESVLVASRGTLYNPAISLVWKRVMFTSSGTNTILFVNTDTFTEDGVFTFDAGDVANQAMVVDEVNGVLYASACTQPCGNQIGQIYKIDILTRTKIAKIRYSNVFAPADGYFNDLTPMMAITGGNLFFGIQSPGGCFPNLSAGRITLATFTKNGTSQCSAGTGATSTGQGMVDGGGNFYIMGSNAPGLLVKWSSAGALIGTAAANAGESGTVATSSAMSSSNIFYGFQSGANRRFVKFGISPFARVDGFTDNTVANPFMQQYDGLRDVIYFSKEVGVLGTDAIIKVSNNPFQVTATHVLIGVAGNVSGVID